MSAMRILMKMMKSMMTLQKRKKKEGEHRKKRMGVGDERH